MGATEPTSIRKEVLTEMVGSERITSKRNSLTGNVGWKRSELARIRKEILVGMVGSEGSAGY